jgi:HSP20 family protein
MIRRRRDDELATRDYWAPFSWSPLRILEEMDRMFDDLRMGFENYLAVPGGFGTTALRAPAIDLIDEGNEYKLHAEMPGIKKEDINLEVGEDEIEISAESKEEKKEGDEKKGYIRRERRYSKFYRRIPLPQPINPDKVEAELKDGVLTVKLPKISPPEKKTKKVGVK